MKKLIICATILITGIANAQSRPIRIEVEDLTNVQLLSAEYNLMREQKNQKIEEANQTQRFANLGYINKDLDTLLKNEYGLLVPDKKIIKEIENLQKDSYDISDITNVNRYYKKLNQITNKINNLNLKINAQY